MKAKFHCKVHYGDGGDDEEEELEEFYDYSRRWIYCYLLLSQPTSTNSHEQLLFMAVAFAPPTKSNPFPLAMSSWSSPNSQPFAYPQIVPSPKCKLCNTDCDETINHLFLLCPMVRSIRCSYLSETNLIILWKLLTVCLLYLMNLILKQPKLKGTSSSFWLIHHCIISTGSKTS